MSNFIKIKKYLQQEFYNTTIKTCNFYSDKDVKINSYITCAIDYTQIMWRIRNIQHIDNML